MSDDYIHGFSAEEQRRLTRMQDLLNEGELRLLDLRGVRSILDVGAGLGQMSRALARAAGPGARVVGIERDARQRAEAERQARDAGEGVLVEFRAGDAESLPLAAKERGSFDLAHARFLLEHVRDPLSVVREMVGAVRPGGRIALLDDDHEQLRLWPACPEVESVWTRYWESYRDRGRDPLIGRRLGSILIEAGARPVRVTTLFYGAVSGEPLFGPVVDNLVEVVLGSAEDLDRSGRVRRAEMDAAIASLREWSRGQGATVWYSLPFAQGERPA